MTRQCEQCGAIQDNFAAFADGQLSEVERAEVEARIAKCRHCADLQAQGVVRRHLQALRRRQNLPGPPSRVWSEALKAYIPTFSDCT